MNDSVYIYGVTWLMPFNRRVYDGYVSKNIDEYLLALLEYKPEIQR